jgi:hypothetical protein
MAKIHILGSLTAGGGAPPRSAPVGGAARSPNNCFVEKLGAQSGSGRMSKVEMKDERAQGGGLSGGGGHGCGRLWFPGRSARSRFDARADWPAARTMYFGMSVSDAYLAATSMRRRWRSITA